MFYRVVFNKLCTQEKQVELINGMIILKAGFFPSVLILCCRWLKEAG